MLNGIIASLAVCIWGMGIFWALRTMRRRTRWLEDCAAQMEVEALGWSEKHMGDVVKRYPRSPGPAIVYAQHAYHRADWEEALRRYQLAIPLRPEDERGYGGAALALRELGRRNEAEALLRRGLRRFGDSKRLLRDYAAIADIREEWCEAARRWAAYRAAEPTDKTGYVKGAKALRKAGLAAEAEALEAEAAGRFAMPSDQAIRNVPSVVANRASDGV